MSSRATEMHIDPSRFREVLGHLPTGVTIITAYGLDGPFGMAANSVTSVSLQPPLVLLCPAKSSTTWPSIRRAQTFCVNVLASQHGELSRQFSRKDADRFAGVACSEHSSGPALTDAVAWLDCEIRDEHDAGDHTIVVASVLGMEANAIAAPLIFFKGKYGTFVDDGL